MNRDSISPRAIGVVVVALFGVAILATAAAPAVQAANDTTPTLDTGDMAHAFQSEGVADCSRCHEGTKASLTPELCGECHTDTFETWEDSGHAHSLGEGESGERITSDEQCQSCHVETAIKQRTDIDFQTKGIEVGSEDEPITCESCHAPPEQGWFGHFAKGGDALEPSGTGPHYGNDAQVSSPDQVCEACHSNDVILTLAGDGKIDPHAAALSGEVDGSNDGNTETTTTTTQTTTETASETPGFGIGAAVAALLALAFLGRRHR